MDEDARQAIPKPGGVFERRTIQARGLHYAILLARPSAVDSGDPPILFLHGFTGAGEDFAPVMAALSPTRRAMAPDLPGHGDTDAPLRVAQYELSQTVADLAQIVRTFTPGTVDCVGYSFGGRLALALVVQHPCLVRRCVLESASPGLEDEEARRARREADERLATAILKDGVKAFVDRWEQLPLFATQAGLPAATAQGQRMTRLRQRPDGLAGSLRGAGTGAQPSFWNRLGEVQTPVLLITGDQDPKFTAIAASMARGLPNARHVVVRGVGHNVHLEQPASYENLVRSFLEPS